MSYRLHPAVRQQNLATPPYHVWYIGERERWLEFHRMEHGFLLRFPGLADFTMNNSGAQIGCHPVPGVSQPTIEHLYLNQVLPLARNAAGELSFHGSAIVIGEFAIAFLGASGRGKSTLAASFASSGHAFLTDDALLPEWKGHAIHVMPSHPSVRLWDDSQEEILHSNSKPVLPVDYTSKSRFLAAEGLTYCAESKPFRAAYFLGDGTASDTSIVPLTAAELLVQFLSNSFQIDIENPHTLGRDFLSAADLCQHVKGFALDFARDYDQLHIVRKAILNHANSLGT